MTLLFISMVKCARCDCEVDHVQYVTPDVITKEVIDSIDHGEKDLSGREDTMKVCAECMDELRGD
jgi:hypothetical protein